MSMWLVACRSNLAEHRAEYQFQVPRMGNDNVRWYPRAAFPQVWALLAGHSVYLARLSSSQSWWRTHHSAIAQGVMSNPGVEQPSDAGTPRGESVT
jgi:hypothetical protein